MNLRAMAVAVLLLVGLGCGSPPVEQKVELEPEELQLRQIGQAYSQAIQKLKHGPRDLAELKPFLVAMPASEAAIQGIASRQIIVIWGLGASDLAIKSSRDGPPQIPVVAYFAAKHEDIRFVLATSSRIERMTDEQFQKAYFPKGHKPATTPASAPN